MITTASSITTSDFVTGITVASCIVFSVMILLTNEKKWPNLVIFNRSLIVFTLPLIIIFLYIIILKFVVSIVD